MLSPKPSAHPRLVARYVLFTISLPFGISIEVSKRLKIPEQAVPDDRIVDSWRITMKKIVDELEK